MAALRNAVDIKLNEVKSGLGIVVVSGHYANAGTMEANVTAGSTTDDITGAVIEVLNRYAIGAQLNGNEGNVTAEAKAFLNQPDASLNGMCQILYAAAQVAPLNSRHINSFFQMKMIRVDNARVASFVNSIAPNLPSFAILAAFSEIAKHNDWFRYRVTLASGIGVVRKVISDIPALFDEKEIDLVDDYLANPHEMKLLRAIPQRTIGKAFIIAQADRSAPDTWYMGEKAAAQISMADARAIKTAFFEVVNRKANANLSTMKDAELDKYLHNLR